jgi:TRAP-type C4-dicarboxylate transport system permease large subunit
LRSWHQPGRRLVYLGGEAGLMQVVRNGVASVTNFSLTPIPFFVLMGEVLFHTGLAMRAIDSFDRAIRACRAAVRRGGRRRHGVLGHLGIDHRHHRAAGQPAAAADAAARLPPAMAMGPDHGHRRVDMLIPPSALTVLLGSLAGISISGC